MRPIGLVALAIAASSGCALMTSLGDLAADASADVVSEAPAACIDAATGFCAQVCPRPTFCDDFDLDNTFGRWTKGTDLSNGGTATLEPGGISLPRAAKLQTPALDAGANSYADLQTTIQQFSSITIDAMMRISKPATAFGVVVLAFVPPPGFSATGIALRAKPNAVDVYEAILGADGGSLSKIIPVQASFEVAAWFRLVMTISLADHTISLDLNGSQVMAANAIDPAAYVSNGDVILHMGVDYALGDPGETVELDNVVVTTTP